MTPGQPQLPTSDLAVEDFKLLFEKSPSLLLLVRPDPPHYTIVSVTDAYLDATGTGREQIIGKGIFEVFPDNPEDPTADGVAKLRASLDRVISKRAADNMDVQKYDIPRPIEQGGGFEERYWSPTNVPFLDHQGLVKLIFHRVEDVTRMVRSEDYARMQTTLARELHTEVSRVTGELGVVSKLISERRSAVNALNEGEHYLRLLLDSAADGFYAVDEQGTTTSCNAAFVRMLGFGRAEDAIGKKLHDVIHHSHPDGSHYPKEDCPIYQAAQTGHHAHVQDELFFRLDGSSFPVEYHAVPVIRDGKVAGAITTFTDITMRQKTEAALRSSEKLALVGRLAATIAHEINNPLEAVTNLLYLIQTNTEHADLLKYAQMAQDELARVSHVVTHTLRFHRQSSSATQETISLLLDSAVAIYQGRLAHSGVDIFREYDDVEPMECFGSELRQVFANLIGNAFDACRAGGKIVLRVREGTDWRSQVRGVSVTIADTGQGMSPQTMTHLFQSFYTTKGDSGTGLGLWVSADILKKHQAHIRVKSRQGEGRSGTVFSIFFPRANGGDSN